MNIAGVLTVNNIDVENLSTCIIYDDICKVLNNVPFPCCLIKGKVLSLQAYNKSAARKSGDVDVLISRKNVREFENILCSHGYSCISKDRSDRILCLNSSHQIPPYRKTRAGIEIEVDINFDIFWGEYSGKRIDILAFLSDAKEIELYGCKVKALSPLKSMVQLILHHYKDINSIFLLATRKNIKQDMFKDLFYLLKNNLNDILLDRLYDISLEYEIIPYVYYMLYYTGLLFKDEILEKYITAFKTPEGEALLKCYGLNEAERREWKYDFQTRLESENLYDLIKDDLTEKDLEKITINKKVFLNE
jgi:hypothetical protein